MLTITEMNEKILKLFANDKNTTYKVGHGILTNVKIGFDKEKLEETKHEIATILQEIGIDEHPMISLASLTTLKNGEVWNPLESLEDFQALVDQQLVMMKNG